MNSIKKVTIKDVAKEAGVSVSAVSRVFNNYGDISSKTSSKIIDAAKKLNYFPNHAARKLSSKNKKTIALILNEMDLNKGATLPFEILTNVNFFLEKTDYEFVFYPTNKEKQTEKTLECFCTEHGITGLIIQGLKTTDPYYKELKNFTIPTVAIDLTIENENLGYISIDNVKASQEVTRRLQNKGYKKILFISGKEFDEISEKREMGYKLEVEKPSILYGNYNEKQSYLLIKEIQIQGRVDAIFAASDLMAIGALKALKEKKISIPVVGFDDNILASYVSPSLTTVKQDITLLAEYAVHDLLELISTRQAKHRLLPFEIILRESAQI